MLCAQSCCDTMAVTGALFALLVAATMFTLIVRGFGTDRWVAALLQQLPGGSVEAICVVLPILALCALVLDAFELIFVVVPVVAPPLLTVVPNATWVAVLMLLILQASFLLPSFGYAVLMVRSRSPRPVPMDALTRALFALPGRAIGRAGVDPGSAGAGVAAKFDDAIAARGNGACRWRRDRSSARPLTRPAAGRHGGKARGQGLTGRSRRFRLRPSPWWSACRSGNRAPSARFPRAYSSRTVRIGRSARAAAGRRAG
jgi:hypothetical protein